MWSVAILSTDFLPGDLPFKAERVNHDILRALTSKVEALRVESKETVAPVIVSLEQHTRLLVRLFASADPFYYHELGRLAAETAWLTANAHADNSADHQALRWAKLSARVARETGDEDLRAHAISRMSRTYLDLEQPDEALSVLERVSYGSLTPYGVSRIEVHRALALTKLRSDTVRNRTKEALDALERTGVALLDTAPRLYPRPPWVWWVDDEGFIRSWEAEVLRSLVVPSIAVPVFRDAVSFASIEDHRERPFLQAGLADVLEQGGVVDEAADEAIRAVILARAVKADAAFSRIKRLFARLSSRASGNSYVRALGNALHDL